MSYKREFATIELLINSRIETRGVDAFALSVIKMERQLRRLFTFTVFQYPCFSHRSISEMKAALAAKRNIYAEHFIKGFEVIHPTSISGLIGQDYVRVQSVLPTIKRHRNKIFHGQLTGQELSRKDLLNHVAIIQNWCCLLGDGCRQYMGYEGFDDSFHKATDTAFVSHYKITLSNIDDYNKLLSGMISR